MNANWEHNRFLLPQLEMDKLLRELCVRLGFCSLTDECTKTLRSSPLTIDEFADIVLVGEGIAEPAGRLHTQVRKLVAEHYTMAANQGLWWLKFPKNRPEDGG